jgi:hypothetical protein
MSKNIIGAGKILKVSMIVILIALLALLWASVFNKGSWSICKTELINSDFILQNCKAKFLIFSTRYIIN